LIFLIFVFLGALYAQSSFDDTDTIGFIVFAVVLIIFFIAAGLSGCRKCPPE
jgi:hypothetical protein